MSQATHNRFQLYGWILFIFSAMFYMAASIRADDPLGLAGGTLFLVACIAFLVPLLLQLLQASRGESASSSSPLRKCFRYLSGWFRAVNLRWRAPGARTMPLMPAHLLEQNRRQSIRSELRFFASTR